MLSLMVGLQLAVEHTSATDASDAATITQTWSNRQHGDSDTQATEPVPERMYRIPSAHDRQEIANDQRASALLAATVAESSGGTDGDTASTSALDALVSASADAELQPAIGRALARSVNKSFSLLIATRNDADSAGIDRDAEAGVVVSTLQAALAILNAATAQDRSARAYSFTPVDTDSDGLVHIPQHNNAV